MDRKLGRSLPGPGYRRLTRMSGTITGSGKNRSQETKLSRWGVVALPLSRFVGVLLGAVVGAAVAHIGIGVAVGAGGCVGRGGGGGVARCVIRPAGPAGSRLAR